MSRSQLAVPAALLLGSALLLAATPSSSQAPPSRAELFFDTVDVRVANIEVVVTDKDGNPVAGLTRDDFEVYEDGRRVELTNFFAVEDREVLLLGETGAESPDIEGIDLVGGPETKQLSLVIFIDNYNIRPQNRNLLLADLKDFLESGLDPRDRVMLVVLSDTIEVAHDFTSDPAPLLETIGRLEHDAGGYMRMHAEEQMYFRSLTQATLRNPDGGTAGLGAGVPNLRNFMESEGTAERLAQDALSLADRRMERVNATVQVIGRFTDSLAGLRGRKAVLYLSDGLPLRPADGLAQAWLNKYEAWIQSQGGNNARDEMIKLTSLVGSSRYDAGNLFDELVARASANRVAFYPISYGGALVRSGVSAEWDDSGGQTGRRVLGADVVSLESFSRESSLLQMAEGTGGIAFTRSANVSGLLQRMVRDFETFYSLGYTPTHPQDDDLHEVKVMVRRDGLEVRHLKGYREKDPMQHLQDLVLSALHYGVADNPLGVRLEAGDQVATGRDKYRIELMVKIPFSQLLLLPQGESHASQVSLFVVARDARGGVSPFQRVDLPIQIPNDQVLQALAGAAAYPLQLEINGGAKRISVGVRDHLARVDSTLVLDMTVGAEAGTPSRGTGSR